jgi:hypothetical protein
MTGGRDDTWTPNPVEEEMRQYLREKGYGGDWRDSDHNDAATYLSGKNLIEEYIEQRIKDATGDNYNNK